MSAKTASLWMAESKNRMKDHRKTKQDLIAELVQLREENQSLKKELAEARDLIDAIMECVPEGITVASAPDISIQRVSKRGRELLGISSEIIEGIPAVEYAKELDIFHRDGATRATGDELPLTRAIRVGEVVTGEEWVLNRPDGTKLTILCNAVPIRDRNGTITGGIISWRDTLQRQRAGEELRQARNELELKIQERTADLRTAQVELEAKTKLLEAILSQIPSGVVIAEVPSGRLIIGNQRVEDILRHRFIASKDISDYMAYLGFHADDSPYQPQEWPLARSVAKGEVVINEEIGIRRGDGSFATISVSSSPVFDDKGALTAAVAIFCDISERKQMEVALSQANEKLEVRIAERTADLLRANQLLQVEVSERKQAEKALQTAKAKADLRAAEAEEGRRLLHTLIENIPTGITITGGPPDFPIRIVSRYGLEMTGRPETALLELSAGYHQEAWRISLADGATSPAPEQMPLYRSSRFGDEIRNCEMILHARDGRTFHLLVDSVPVRDGEGKITAAIKCWRDVTGWKQMEGALRKARDELERRNVELDEKSKTLEEVNTALRRLLKQREDDQQELAEKILTNVRSLVLPYLEKLKKTKLTSMQKTLVEILETHLDDVTSSFVRKLGLKATNLTPTELRISSLLRDGKSSAEIADVLSISRKTLETHRGRIRKKLGIQGCRTNLRSYLLTLV